MLSETAGAQTVVQQTTFLESLNQRLAEANGSLDRAASRLSERGFYGPPEATSGSDAKVPQENHMRSEITNKLQELERLAALLTYQIERLA